MSNGERAFSYVRRMACGPVIRSEREKSEAPAAARLPIWHWTQQLDGGVRRGGRFGDWGARNGAPSCLPRLAFEIRADDGCSLGVDRHSVRTSASTPGRAASRRADGGLGEGGGPAFEECCSGSANAAAMVGHSARLCPRLERRAPAYRPVEIAGRATSWRQDDTCAHRQLSVDARHGGGSCVCSPTSSDGRPRNWRVGEASGDLRGDLRHSCACRWPEAPQCSGCSGSRRAAARRTMR